MSRYFTIICVAKGFFSQIKKLRLNVVFRIPIALYIYIKDCASSLFEVLTTNTFLINNRETFHRAIHRPLIFSHKFIHHQSLNCLCRCYLIVWRFIASYTFQSSLVVPPLRKFNTSSLTLINLIPKGSGTGMAYKIIQARLRKPHDEFPNPQGIFD